MPCIALQRARIELLVESAMEYTTERLVQEAKSFHLKKKLGQHFLVSPEALQSIVDALGVTAGDTVVEVGPGLGFLTRPLSQAGANVIAVDLDRESIARLNSMRLPGVELKHGDFMNFDLNTLDFFSATPSGSQAPAAMKVAGNVPYQITGLIIGHILGEIDRPSEWLKRISVIVLTVQREVAQRMVAPPGSPDYSKLSLLMQYFCKASLERTLPPQDFYPPPAVGSAVVKLVPLSQPGAKVHDVRLLKQIIEAGFRQRRKTLPNALSFLRISPPHLKRILTSLAFDPQVRAERLSLQQFAMLADAIHLHLTTNAQNQGACPSES